MAGCAAVLMHQHSMQDDACTFLGCTVRALLAEVVALVGRSWYLLQMDLQQPGQYANVMSFKYMRGPVVTILVSKSAGRYRIQSDSFEAMWLIVQV